MIKSARLACVIPTYNAGIELDLLLSSVRSQKIDCNLFVIDSNSSDNTVAIAKNYSAEVTIIKSSEFNHGGTRQRVINENSNFDFYIFLTQDAYLEDSDSFEKIIQPFHDGMVGAVCGRQLPHHNATPLAKHARLYNYPSKSTVRSIHESSIYGMKVAFMSNSFAAYRRTALMAVGGFPSDVIFAEDMFVAAKMLKASYKIAYASEATCRHSHNYTFSEEFRRYFDMGVFHAREKWIRETFGSVGGEGIRYAKSEISFVKNAGVGFICSSIIRSAIKYLAFKIGRAERYLPLWIKNKIGMYRGYWRGI